MKTAKRLVMVVLQVLVTAGVVGAFVGWPYCVYVCRIQPSYTWTFGVVALLSLVMGRFFCRALCPLGAVQDLASALVRPKTKVRRVCTRLGRTKAQHVVNWLIVMLSLVPLFGIGAAVNPYGVFGRFVSVFTRPASPPSDCVMTSGALTTGFIVFAIGLFAAVVVLSLFGRGRFWCNWICPFGTVFDALSRLTPFGDRIGSRCAHCRRCFAGATSGGAEKPVSPSAGEASCQGVTRRETLCGVAALVAVAEGNHGGQALVTMAAEPEAPNVLPPGVVGSAERFSMTCVGCQLCVTKCPSHIIKPIDWSGRVGMSFREGYCISNCTKCGEVCPAGALRALSPAEKREVRIGVAVWDARKCLRTTAGESCRACVRKCPSKALRVVDGRISVDAGACVGCGACEFVCGARPEPAIRVEGLRRQWMKPPMSESELLAEMQRIVREGASIVVARGGVIRTRQKGPGVMPTLQLLDAERLAGATVCDKVVGRAAAAIFIVGRVKSVWAEVMSEEAAALLSAHGVSCSAAETVKEILNKDRSARCPLEIASDGKDDPEEIVRAVREKTERMAYE